MIKQSSFLVHYPWKWCQVVAVAARNLKTAQEFANKFDIPKAYEGKIINTFFFNFIMHYFASFTSCINNVRCKTSICPYMKYMF